MLRRKSRDPFAYDIFGVVTALSFACSSASAPAETPTVAPAPASEPTPAIEPAADASADPPTSAGEPPPEAASAEQETDADAPRDIRYIKTPEGLRVEILGVKFVPKAEALKTPSGIGVRLTLEATASEARSLLAPAHGPLAFAGAIQRKGKAEAETFGDERKGDGELLLDAKKPTKIVREWPGKQGGGLGNGDVLELDVGLWGLGADAADRRPVKQLLRVKVVVENWKGRARVEPPPSVKGQG
jgi:hypothetical protein